MGEVLVNDREEYWYAVVRPKLSEEFYLLDTGSIYTASDIPEKVLFETAYAFAEFSSIESIERLIRRISLTLSPTFVSNHGLMLQFDNDVHERLMSNAEWVAVVELTRSTK